MFKKFVFQYVQVSYNRNPASALMKTTNDLLTKQKPQKLRIIRRQIFVACNKEIWMSALQQPPPPDCGRLMDSLLIIFGSLKKLHYCFQY